jgi:hypothetical protein
LFDQLADAFIKIIVIAAETAVADLPFGNSKILKKISVNQLDALVVRDHTDSSSVVKQFFASLADSGRFATS